VQDEDRQLLEFLAAIGRDALIVATKTDKLSRSQVWPALQELKRQTGGVPVLGFSAETCEGRDELWRAILKRAALSAAVPG
jgi:GTP-binding protein EngB required for normal cell division